MTLKEVSSMCRYLHNYFFLIIPIKIFFFSKKDVQFFEDQWYFLLYTLSMMIKFINVRCLAKILI